MTQHITYPNAKAELFSFTGANEVDEHHIILHASNSESTFQQQLDETARNCSCVQTLFPE